jgi:penicillin-binding protein 1A
VETLNTMLQGVVTGGTGKAAQLDFTYSAGKTGTSSSYRDAWFIGFTGQYVVGVWVGNDDFTPMSRVTGGSFPAQTWHEFMVQARDTDNIPPIPGIEPHPVQVAEQERLARLQTAAAADTDGEQPVIPAPTPESVKDMTSATRQILERIGDMLRQAPTLDPSDTKPDGRAEAPRAQPSASGSNVAAATDASAGTANLPQASPPGPNAAGEPGSAPPQ